MHSRPLPHRYLGASETLRVLPFGPVPPCPSGEGWTCLALFVLVLFSFLPHTPNTTSCLQLTREHKNPALASSLDKTVNLYFGAPPRIRLCLGFKLNPTFAKLLPLFYLASFIFFPDPL